MGEIPFGLRSLYHHTRVINMKPGASLSNHNTPATIKVITPSMTLATKVATILSTQTTVMATEATKGIIRPNSSSAHLPGAFLTMDCLLLITSYLTLYNSGLLSSPTYLPGIAKSSSRPRRAKHTLLKLLVYWLLKVCTYGFELNDMDVIE